MEVSERRKRPFKVSKVNKKVISITHFVKIKPFNISAVIKIFQRSNDGYLKSEIQSIQSFVIHNDQIQLISSRNTKYLQAKELNPRNVKML